MQRKLRISYTSLLRSNVPAATPLCSRVGEACQCEMKTSPEYLTALRDAALFSDLSSFLIRVLVYTCHQDVISIQLFFGAFLVPLFVP